MTPQQANISQRLRDLTQELRRTPKPLAEIIPLLNAAADELDRRAPAPTEPAVDRGLEAAAALVERKVAAYDAECGNTDPETGTREYPGEGASWMMEMEELAEEIRALATPASPAVPAGMMLVPTEPTKAMIDRAWLYGNPAADDAPDPVYAYKAMLASVAGLPHGRAVPAHAPLAPKPISNSEAAEGQWAGDSVPQVPPASQPTSTPGPMRRLICQLASLKSHTPEAVNLLVEEAKRVMGQDGGAEGGDNQSQEQAK